MERRAEHDRALRQRRRDVVAVADERDRAARPFAPHFFQRLQVGQRLARVLGVAQRVHDVKARRRVRELEQRRVRVGPHDDALDPALEIASHVDGRLALAERGDRVWRDDVAAELAHGDLEGRDRAQRRFLEQQRDVSAAERVRGRGLLSQRAIALDACRQRKARLELGGLEVENRHEILGANCDGIVVSRLKPALRPAMSGSPR